MFRCLDMHSHDIYYTAYTKYNRRLEIPRLSNPYLRPERFPLTEVGCLSVKCSEFVCLLLTLVAGSGGKFSPDINQAGF